MIPRPRTLAAKSRATSAPVGDGRGHPIQSAARVRGGSMPPISPDPASSSIGDTSLDFPGSSASVRAAGGFFMRCSRE